MLKLGKFNRLVVEKTTEFGFYLSDGTDRRNMVLLPNKYVPENLDVDDELDVFLYLDSEDRIVATTQTPLAQLGDLARLRVKEQTRIGAFLDWGLDKDLFVPFREQPVRLTPGELCLVKLYLDPVTGRIAASRRLSRFYTGDVSKLRLNQKVRLTVWEEARLGWRVIADDSYVGLVYFNELCRTLHPGDRLDGYVHAIRAEENRIDVRLRPDGIEGIKAFKPAVLDALEDAGGFLPLNAKSDLAAVRDYFSFSKRVFKQVIGMLYKEGRITIAEDGIRLNPPQEEKQP